MKRLKKSPSEKLPNSSPCTHKPSENGQMQEESHLNVRSQDKEEYSCTKIQPKKKAPTKSSKPSTAGSQATNKKMTLNDKSSPCKKNSRTTGSIQTSDPVSTSSEKTFSPFWTHHCQDLCQKLWSSQGIGCCCSDSSCVNGYSCAKEPSLSSWSKRINHQKKNCVPTSYPSFTFSAAGEMAQDVTIHKAHKVKLCPTKRQRQALRNWAAGYRLSYNKALDFKKENTKLSKFDLRTLIVTKKQNSKSKTRLFGEHNINPIFQKHPWLSKVPKDIRQQAVFELFKNWRQEKGNVSYKDRLKDTSTISLEKEHVKVLDNGKIRLYSGKLKNTLRTFGKMPKSLLPSEFEDEVKPPCQVLLQRQGRSYYMIFPIKEEEKAVPTTYKGHMVGVDPGIRTFQTCYGTDGKVAFLGNRNPMRKFARTQWYLDLLNIQINNLAGMNRKKSKKKRIKVQQRLENIRKDFHHKSTKWLTDNYKAIIIGKLPKGIISRDRSLPKSVKRAFNNLGHYKFRCCLKDKCQRRGVVYHEINESYTSKTCTMCGKLNDIGSSEVYHCNCQKNTWNRDINGARNILMKGISESYLRIGCS